MSDETKPCADCGEHKPIMVALRAPMSGGGTWFLCSGCYKLSLELAEAERRELAAKLAEIERKAKRQTHARERMGSH